jgi:ribosomal protein L11 methylase PrmA
MLELAKLTNHDTLYDLGSGDGRIVITAAKKYGANAVGYEIDPQLVRESRANIEKAGLKDLASIEAADLFNADVDKANVVALYLPEKLLEQMMPLFDKMGCGSRIVSHQFKIPGVTPVQTLQVQSKEDGDLHTIYLWQTPFTKEKK